MNVVVTLSDFLGFDDELDKEGVFNPILDIDANYFINIKRLQVTKEKYFEKTYEKIQAFFAKIYRLLKIAPNENSRLYKEAVKMFIFPEINNLGLGYSKGKQGSGFGREIAQRVIKDAKEIIDAGNTDSEFFQLIGLFEEKVGPDRLSDMYSNLIIEEIMEYTKWKNKELGINKRNFPNHIFVGELLINPYKNKPVLLLPKDILHELPIAKEWEDIDEVCSKIKTIRDEVNDVVGEKWRELSVIDKKSFIKNNIIKVMDRYEKVISEYTKYNVDAYDFENDKAGFVYIPKVLKGIELEPLELSKKESEKDIVVKICDKFKRLLENNAISKLLYDKDGEFRGEKAVQLLFFGIADSYCEANDLDINPELNSGRGNIDFKFSKGYKKRIIVEIKLTSNRQLVHGMKTQIFEYAKAEKTDELIYLVVDNKGSEKTLKKLYEEYNKLDKKPILIVIDPQIKDSASIYEGDK